MKSPICLLLPLLLVSVALGRAAEDPAKKAQELADAVWKASGGENWAKVKRLRFTFIVEQDGKMLASAQHDWDIAAGTDEVKWKDKQVTVRLDEPAQDENSKAAYARWVNDSYWLLAPLKVRDRGVKLSYEGLKQVGGAPCEALRLSFEQVGLTPGDQYLLYLDPQTKLVRAWDYIEKDGPPMRGTWEKYETFGGLKLAIEHNFEGKMIRFADVQVR